jgi:hypothetical protein
MRFFSNLPGTSPSLTPPTDNDHVPYQFLKAEPHIKKVFTYMRPSDFVLASAVTIAFPTALYAWERSSPSMHPRILSRIMMVQIPFYAVMGMAFGIQNTYMRFWGWVCL